MQEAFSSFQVLENHWNQLAAEMDALSLAWRDKASSTFERDYWIEVCGLMLSSLPDLREGITQIQRLARDVGADVD